MTQPQYTGSNENQIGWGIWSLATGGVLYAWGFMDDDPPIIGNVIDTTADNFRAPAHGLVVDQRCLLLASPGLLLPAGVSENVEYFVGTVDDADTLSLSTTAADANPVAITALGGAMIMPYKSVTVATNATPEFAIGALVLQL